MWALEEEDNWQQSVLYSHSSSRQIRPARSLEGELWPTGERGLLVCLGMRNSCDVEVQDGRVVIGGSGCG